MTLKGNPMGAVKPTLTYIPIGGSEKKTNYFHQNNPIELTWESF